MRKGAGLVTSYVYANGEDPIIKGAIANSGSIGGRPRDSDTPNKFSQVAEIAGCGGLEAAEELTCMQEVSALRLQSILQSGTEEVPMFGAVVDNVTVFANSTERLERGLVAKVVRSPPLFIPFYRRDNLASPGIGRTAY